MRLLLDYVAGGKDQAFAMNTSCACYKMVVDFGCVPKLPLPKKVQKG